MSYRKRLLLVNNFFQTLDTELQARIDAFIGNDYSMDDKKILSYFGLEDRFADYISDYEFDFAA